MDEGGWLFKPEIDLLASFGSSYRMCGVYSRLKCSKNYALICILSHQVAYTGVIWHDFFSDITAIEYDKFSGIPCPTSNHACSHCKYFDKKLKAYSMAVYMWTEYSTADLFQWVHYLSDHFCFQMCLLIVWCLSDFFSKVRRVLYARSNNNALTRSYKPNQTSAKIYCN